MQENTESRCNLARTEPVRAKRLGIRWPHLNRGRYAGRRGPEGGVTTHAGVHGGSDWILDEVNSHGGRSLARADSTDLGVNSRIDYSWTPGCWNCDQWRLDYCRNVSRLLVVAVAEASLLQL